MTGRTGLLESLRVNGRGGISFSHDSVFGMAGVTLGAKIRPRTQTMPVVLLVAFPARDSSGALNLLMRFIFNVGMAVETGEGGSMNGVFEIFHGYLQDALLASLLVATNALLGSVCSCMGLNRPSQQQGQKE